MTPPTPDIKVVPDDMRDICGTCSGSGEGHGPGTVCSTCGGCGEVFFKLENNNDI